MLVLILRMRCRIRPSMAGAPGRRRGGSVVMPDTGEQNHSPLPLRQPGTAPAPLDARGAQGIQVGDGNIQLNVFAAPEAKRRPWMVPAPGGPVTERPRLTEALLAGLTAADTSPLAMTVAIEGAGGFGKTTLAAHA